MEVAILIGLPASGKSTFFRLFLGKTHLHVSKDLMRKRKHKQLYQEQMITRALEAGQSVAVDNTNISEDVRAPLIELARSFGAKVTGYYFESSVKESLKRNSRRAGKARVPDVAVHFFSKRLERPEYREGFDDLFSIRIEGNMAFRIQRLARSKSIQPRGARFP